MNNLLSEVKRGGPVLDIDIDIELGETDDFDEQPQSRRNPFVDKFYQQVSEIKTELANIDSNTKQLEQKYNESFAVVKNHGKLKYMREQFESLRQETKEKIDTVKAFLEAVNKQNRELQKSEPGSSALRIRENQHQALTNEFIKVVKEFARVNSEYKVKHKESLARQIRIANKDASDDEVEKMVDDPNFDESSYFSKQLMNTSAAQTAKAMFAEIRETKEDLIKLEGDMNELASMFQDMYVLLTTQQDLIDNIERNVMKSTAYIEKGVKDIRTAKKYQKKGSVMTCVLISVILGLAVIAVIIVVILVVVLTLVLK